MENTQALRWEQAIMVEEGPASGVEAGRWALRLQNGPKGIEQRRSRRWTRHWTVELRWREGWRTHRATGQNLDISQQGIRVALDQSIPMNTECDLTVQGPGRPWTGRTSVSRCTPGDSAAWQMMLLWRDRPNQEVMARWIDGATNDIRRDRS